MSDPEFAKRTKNGTKPTQELVNAVTMDSANRLLTRLTLERIKAYATGTAVTGPSDNSAEPKKKSKATKKTVVEE